MQEPEVNINPGTTEDAKPLYSAEISINSLLVRVSGLLLFCFLIAIALVLGLFDLYEFTEIISDVRIMIPVVISCYLVRFAVQFIVLKFFTGLEKDQVRVGFSDRNITPFVHSKRPFVLSIFRYYIIMPLVVVTVVPFISSIFIYSEYLYVISSFTAAFCINDIISFIRSLKYPGYMLASDHPQHFGFVLYDNPFHEI